MKLMHTLLDRGLVNCLASLKASRSVAAIGRVSIASSTAVFLSVLTSGVSYAANVVNNSSFATPLAAGPVNTYLPGQTLGDWTVTSGSVDLLSNSYWHLNAGGQSIDLSGNEPGSISQNISTTPGTAYQLSFELAGNPDGKPSAKIGSVSFGSFTQNLTSDITNVTRSNLGDVEKSFLVPGSAITSSSTPLTFTSTTTGPYGPVLSGVSVSAVTTAADPVTAAADPVITAAVPEPTSPLLDTLAFGGLSAAYLLKRKLKQPCD